MDELMNFYDNHQDEIHQAFEEHIADIQDGFSHRSFLANSEEYFWEFVSEYQMENYPEYSDVSNETL